MKTTEPTTWKDIADHPSLRGGQFERHWYDGDAVADLAMLRLAAVSVLSMRPGCTCELFLLDDCTMYIDVRTAAGRCQVYPSQTHDNRPCYFVDIVGDTRELRARTVEQLVSLISRMGDPESR